MTNAVADPKTQPKKDNNYLDLWPENGQAQTVVKTPLKSLAEVKKEKEVSHMAEAPASFNIKFIHAGYECQFTVRGEQDVEVLTRARQAIAALKVMGADPVRIVAASNHNNGNGNGKHTETTCLCPACKVEGQPVQGTSHKNGRAYRSLKCPQCHEFLPGTFRWA